MIQTQTILEVADNSGAKSLLTINVLGQAKKGDTVRISETRPISRNKCWRLVEIISRAVQE